MSLRLLGALVALAGLGGLSRAQTSPEITVEDLKRHVFTLASDEWKGRPTGSEEGVAAANYLAAELKRFGVAPGGENGSYFQRVPMGRTEFLALPSLSVVGPNGEPISGLPVGADGKPALAAGVDFDLAEGGCESRTLKVVVADTVEAMPQKPDASIALAVLADNSRRANEWLAAAGYPEGEGFGLIVLLGSKDAGRAPSTRPPGPRPKLPPATPRIRVRGALRQAVIDGKLASLTYAAPIRATELVAYNVVGKIAGAGSPQAPGQASEYLEFSAHYDHLASESVAEGVDGIYNGADDDASGCAVVLELAEAFASGPRPARSLLFFFATGEEIGLVGTRHSLEHPLVDLDKIVLDINFEMLGRPDPKLTPPDHMWLTGFERSNLGEELRKHGVPVVADLRPEQDFFRRSDNYALAMRGIVAQTLSSFGLHEDYHRVSDEADAIDYVHLQKCAAGAWVGCRALANGDFRPVWHPGMDPSKPAERNPPPRHGSGKETGGRQER